MNEIQNASQLPQVYFGLHMVAGLAEYPEMEDQPRILIEEDALTEMDPTFQGRPVYIHHVEKVELEKLEEEMAGVVVRSFFNQADGKHWVEFVVTSDEGHKCIARGWKLSNSYIPTQEGPGGDYHGVPYKTEIKAGKYNHLALTPTPRYAESVVLTPEEFKQYNADMLEKRKALQNSKKDGGSEMKLFFSKKETVKNAQDLEGLDVTLPRTKKTVSLEQVLNDLDERMEREGKHEEMANTEHMVKLHDGTMCNVGELVEKHKMLNEEHEALKVHYDELEKALTSPEDHNKDPEADKKNEETLEEKTAREKKENEEKAKKNKKNEEEEALKEKRNALLAKVKNFKNANLKAGTENEPGFGNLVETSADRVELGRTRYGSDKKK